MSTYCLQLDSAKSAALAVLTELLTITTNLIEKRRIATAILRLPTPKADTDKAVAEKRACQSRNPGHPRMGDAEQPVRAAQNLPVSSDGPNPPAAASSSHTTTTPRHTAH